MGIINLDLKINKIFLVITETIVVAAIQFAIYAFLARNLALNILGFWFLTNGLLGYLKIADVWSKGLTAFIAQAQCHSLEKAKNIFVTCLFISVIGYMTLGTLAIIFIITLLPYFTVGIELNEYQLILIFICINHTFLSVTTTVQAGLLGFDLVNEKILMTIVPLLFFCVAICIFVPSNGIWGIIYAQSVQSIGAVIIAFLLLYWSSKKIWKGSFDSVEIKKLLRFGTKAFFLSSVQAAIDPALRLLSATFGGLQLVAVFELASRLVMFARAMLLSAGQLLIPAYARITDDMPSKAKSLQFQMQENFIRGSIILYSLVLLSAYPIELYVLKQKETGFTPILIILTYIWIFNTLSASSHFWLFAKRKIKPLVISHLIMLFGIAIAGAMFGSKFGVLQAMAACILPFTLASIYLNKFGPLSLGEYFHILHSNILEILIFCFSSCISIFIFSNISDHQTKLVVICCTIFLVMTLLPRFYHSSKSTSALMS